MKTIPYIIIILLLVGLSSCQKNKRHLVVSKIKSTAKLATTETVIDKIVIGQKGREFFGLVSISNSEFVAKSQAIVKTGIDLTKIRPESVKIVGNTIEITLPPIEVIDFSYPFDKFEIDHELSDNTFLSKIDVIDQEIFFRKAELDIRKHLKYFGIQEETQKTTRKFMYSMLQNMGYKEIYISFEDTTELIQQVNTDIFDNYGKSGE